MKILKLIQGTEDWIEARRKYFTASEAPAMMGASKRLSRNDLLRLKATGAEQEISDYTRDVIFERGHEVEAKARAIAEQIIGEELYPATAVDDEGELLASFDGITMLEDTVWECKQWNQEKAALVRKNHIPEEDVWQIVQQLRVSRAARCLYMVTDGTEENTVFTWFERNEKLEKQLLAGWKQFADDLANYEPPEPVAEVVGKRPENLPALHIEVTGMVKASNLSAFKEHALAVVEAINKDLQTDEDFATAEQTVKWCGEVEKKLDAAKEHALAQTQDIDALFRTIDDIREQFRRTRLDLDKLVKARKEAIRNEILQAGKEAYGAHLAKLNESLVAGAPLLNAMSGTAPTPDFAGVMKGKKTVKSLRDAVDQELARVKIAANEIAERVRANLKTLEGLVTDDQRCLIQDWRELVFKDGEAMEAIVKNRVTEHEQVERERLDRERERIRQEEAAKLQREQEERERAAQLAEQQEAQEAQERAAAAVTPAPEKPAAVAPKPAPAEKPQPVRTLQDELDAWQIAHEINVGAFRALLAILDRHHVLEKAA